MDVTTELLTKMGSYGIIIAGLLYVIRYLAQEFKAALINLGARSDEREKRLSETFEKTIAGVMSRLESIVVSQSQNNAVIDGRLDGIKIEIAQMRSTLNMIHSEILYEKQKEKERLL